MRDTGDMSKLIDRSEIDGRPMVPNPAPAGRTGDGMAWTLEAISFSGVDRGSWRPIDEGPLAGRRGEGVACTILMCGPKQACAIRVSPAARRLASPPPD